MDKLSHQMPNDHTSVVVCCKEIWRGVFLFITSRKLSDNCVYVKAIVCGHIYVYLHKQYTTLIHLTKQIEPLLYYKALLLNFFCKPSINE